MATAVVDNTTALNSTVTFTFSGLSEAEEVELLQIWSHNYAANLTVGGQTYTDNPGLFLSFSGTSTYTTGDIRFYGDSVGTISNRPLLTIDAVPEPTSLTLLSLGLTGAVIFRRRCVSTELRISFALK